MAFNFKLPFGADFKDDKDKREPILKGNGAKKNSPKKRSAPAPKNENSRITSVLLFAAGVLCMLITLIPGTAGWQRMHEFMLGCFGISSLLVPAVLIAASILIGLEKDRGRVKNMVIWSLILTVVISSGVQIFVIGELPGRGFWNNITRLYDGGKRLHGGGVASYPISAVFFALFGTMGARIVIVLLLFVMIMLITGKGIIEFFEMLLEPFKFLGRCMEGVQNLIMGEEFEDAFDDEEDEYTDENEDSAFNQDLEALEIVNNKKPPEEDKNDRGKDDEKDEFSMFFDIPLPEEKPKFEKKQPDSELDKLIDRAAKSAEKNPESVAEEKDEKDSSKPQPVYILPGLDLLTPPDTRSNSAEAAQEMREKADTIVNTLKSFGVEVKIKSIYRGPSITRYEIQPGAGVKVSKIKGLEDDIALSLAAQGVRIEAPVPGKAAVGIEVPNINKDTVTIREILSTPEFRSAQSKLAFAVGKDITGNAIVGDISKMPHVIIAGTTGSGKSVCTRSIIMSILYKATPDEVKIILIDPKVVEFKVFEGIPHLLIPIVTEAKKAAGALNWAVNEMMRRYNTFADIGANDLKSYNEIAESDGDIPTMPQIVVFIDELADMMLVAGKEVEDSICRLAQMGRAAGMHLVVATQRPTTDVITGLIKANIPSRIALSVMSQVDSRTIIDMAGADKLLGNGDMLYMPIGTSKPVRIQGCFASTKDINETLNFIRSQAEGSYDSHIIEAVENFVPQTKGDRGGTSDSGFEAGSDEDYVIKAAEVAVNNGQLSTTMLQKKLKLGYARASRIMDELEERGIIGPSEGSKPRKILMSKMQFDEWKLRMMEGA